MQRLKGYQETPPDLYRYVDPDTGHMTVSHNVVQWVDDATLHRLANGLPVPADLQQQMEDQLCGTIPPEWCLQVDPNRPFVSTRFGWQDVQDGLNTFLSWISGGTKLVTQEEADRRAKICSACYLNVHVEGCATCHKLAAALTWNRATAYDNNLKACAVCHCLLKAACHFPINDLESGDSEEHQKQYPSFCWRKRNGENYRT